MLLEDATSGVVYSEYPPVVAVPSLLTSPVCNAHAIRPIRTQVFSMRLTSVALRTNPRCSLHLRARDHEYRSELRFERSYESMP